MSHQSLTFPICDLFVSVQGEATWSGRPMVFCRFWGCPLACPWCDEPLHRDPAARKDLSMATILREMGEIGGGIPFVLLTGGEPLAIAGLNDFIAALKEANYWVAMETSGVGGEWPDNLDWLTLSPKTLLSHALMKRADEIKFIVSARENSGQESDIDHWMRHHPNVWVQPQADQEIPNPQAITRCLKLVMASRGRLRLSIQSHKWLSIP